LASDVAKSLHEQEMRLYEQVKDLAKTAADENRNFTTDEQAKWDQIHTELDGVDTRLKQVLETEKRARQTDEAYNEFAGRPANSALAKAGSGIEEQVRAFAKGEIRSFDVAPGGRLFQAIKGGRPLSPTEARDIGSPYLGGTPAGSFTNQTNAGIVPIDFYDQLLSYLVEVSGVMQTGPSVLNTQGGEPIQIPQVGLHTGYVTGGGIGPANESMTNLSAQQGTQLPSSDPKFTQMVLSSNKFGITVNVDRELLDDSGVNLLGYLAMSAGRAIGNNLGYALINGGNVTNGLLSVAPTAGTAATGTANGKIVGGPAYQDLVNLEYSVIAPYRQSKSCYWMCADATVGKLRQLTDNQGRPLWEPSTVLGAPDLVLGKPIVADPFMPAIAGTAKSILFGDFSQFFVRLVGGVRFERSDDFLFNKDQVAFRAVLRADSNLNYLANTPPPIVTFQGASS
jgi:HK97 family phage major capsid protein